MEYEPGDESDRCECCKKLKDDLAEAQEEIAKINYLANVRYDLIKKRDLYIGKLLEALLYAKQCAETQGFVGDVKLFQTAMDWIGSNDGIRS